MGDCETVWPTTTQTPTEPAGCCYGEGVKENEMCGNKVGRAQCERNDACEFRSGADADCSYTETTDTIEPGCCYGDTAKTNEMCAEKETRDQCERSGKCEFRSGIDADCELPTTTSEPWLGEKAQDEAAEEYALPYNPYKSAQSKSRKSSKAGRRQEQAMLFGADSAVAQAM